MRLDVTSEKKKEDMPSTFENQLVAAKPLQYFPETLKKFNKTTRNYISYILFISFKSVTYIIVICFHFT
jgi:hypothetical protein